MKKLLILPLLIFAINLSGQVIQNSQIQYKINAKIDLKKKILIGECLMTYRNDSQKPLTSISVNLHANAFQSRHSAYAKQLKDFGDQDFYFAKVDQKGGYNSIEFTSGDDVLKWSYKEKTKEIVRIQLSKPLKPGESTTVCSKFELKVPDYYSRLGIANNFIFFDLWHPTISSLVNDVFLEYEYLENLDPVLPLADYEAELYVDPGFKVVSNGIESITNPANLNNWEGIRHGFELKHVKTLVFAISDKAEIKNENYTSATGHKIRLSVFMPKDSIKNAETLIVSLKSQLDSLEHHLGTLNFDKFVFISGGIKKSLFYQGLTIAGLQDTKCKCVDNLGKQFGKILYNSLEDNGFEHPMLLSSLDNYIGQRSITDARGLLSQYPTIFYSTVNQHGFRQPMNMDISGYSNIGYEINTKYFGLFYFAQLEQLIGTEAFFKGVKTLHQLPKHSIISEETIKNAFLETTEKDLSWLFEDTFLNSKTQEYKVKDLKIIDSTTYELTVQNYSKVKAPVTIYSYENRDLASFRSYDGFYGIHKFQVDNHKRGTYGVNTSQIFGETNINNNYRSNYGLVKRTINKSHRVVKNVFSTGPPISLFPTFGYNVYDKLMFGFNANNVFKEKRSFHYSIMPMYSFGGKKIVGSAFMNYEKIIMKGILRSIEAGLKFRSYDVETGQLNERKYRYFKLNPYLTINLNNTEDRPEIAQSITLKQYYIGNFDDREAYRLQYSVEKITRLNPYKFMLGLQSQSYYYDGVQFRRNFKIDIDYFAAFQYQKDKSIELRFAGGVFIHNKERHSRENNSNQVPGTLSLFGRGVEDQFYEAVMPGRYENKGLWAKQITGQGVFHNNISTKYSYGTSNNYLLALSLKAHLPFMPAAVPFKLYGDVGLTPFYNDFISKKPDGMELNFVAGVCFETDEDFGIFFPIITSKNFKKSIDENGYASAIGIKFKLESLELIFKKKSDMKNTYLKNKYW